MLTVAEVPEYIHAAEKLLSETERADVIAYLAAHPRAGARMAGTGGIRKLRWSRGNKGKSGGVRLIYYFHNDAMPLYLLTLFAKGDMENLSKAQRNELAELGNALVQAWRNRK